ncbi:MAG TPA: hypothetical protein VE961_01170, partial [Pyrinomonadaceae bacterium]|nr:hypothetical protein [Pyrinomonadaceae bacterium]
DLDQKFCRKCGFNLAPVGTLMLADGDHREEPKLDKGGRDQQIMRRMVSWMMWGMLILLIGIVLTVVNKQLKVDALLGLIGTLLMLGGVSVATYGVLDALRCGALKEQKPKATSLPIEAETGPVSATRQLEGHAPIPIASVTERTTDLIGVDSKQRS